MPWSPTPVDPPPLHSSTSARLVDSYTAVTVIGRYGLSYSSRCGYWTRAAVAIPRSSCQASTAPTGNSTPA